VLVIDGAAIVELVEATIDVAATTTAMRHDRTNAAGVDRTLTPSETRRQLVMSPPVVRGGACDAPHALVNDGMRARQRGGTFDSDDACCWFALGRALKRSDSAHRRYPEISSRDRKRSTNLLRWR
jgi:hypothetical protein